MYFYSTKQLYILTNPTTLCILILSNLLGFFFRQGEYSTKIIVSFEADTGFFFIVPNPNFFVECADCDITSAPLRLQLSSFSTGLFYLRKNVIIQ